MTKLETELLQIIEIFNKYAITEGKKETLTIEQLKKMMEKELPGFLQAGKGKEDYDKLMKDLVEHGDSKLDFIKFVTFVATLTYQNRFKK
ncbi:protein S100-P-like [Aquarana catesbeiana]|uniref:protein S100-P-like n=1 Tax=Aquarana catesbeiana TaxID=8400 RepID=UPI003CC942BD